MVEWFAVILLIAVGLGLIIAEVLFIPGTTVVGFLGFVFVVAGILISFLSFDRSTGFIVLTVSVISGLSALVIGFKAGAWEKFTLKSSLTNKFNEERNIGLKAGDTGITVSALRPVGKAEFKDKIYEVSTQGNYLMPGLRVKIIHISGSKIMVEPLN